MTPFKVRCAALFTDVVETVVTACIHTFLLPILAIDYLFPLALCETPVERWAAIFIERVIWYTCCVTSYVWSAALDDMRLRKKRRYCFARRMMADVREALL